MSDDSGDADSELGLLADNAAEAGLAWSGPPAVRREYVSLRDGRRAGALRWGTEAPQLILLHGGSQNAHTWDTVALALGRPLIALDLPGHGRSDWRDDHDYAPVTLAGDLGDAIGSWAPDGAVIVGMSLGGLAALALSQSWPALVHRLVLVDILPGTDAASVEPIVAFLSGPERFDTFQEMLDRTVAFTPNRALSAVRRGVLHNSVQLADGSWTWRWDPIRQWRMGGRGGEGGAVDFTPLWSAVDALRVPILLVRGSKSRIVSDGDVAELLRRQPAARVVTIEGAGHSVQGDRPVELAHLLSGFVGPAGP